MRAEPLDAIEKIDEDWWRKAFEKLWKKTNSTVLHHIQVEGPTIVKPPENNEYTERTLSSTYHSKRLALWRCAANIEYTTPRREGPTVLRYDHDLIWTWSDLMFSHY